MGNPRAQDNSTAPQRTCHELFRCYCALQHMRHSRSAESQDGQGDRGLRQAILHLVRGAACENYTKAVCDLCLGQRTGLPMVQVEGDAIVTKDSPEYRLAYTREQARGVG